MKQVDRNTRNKLGLGKKNLHVLRPREAGGRPCTILDNLAQTESLFNMFLWSSSMSMTIKPATTKRQSPLKRCCISMLLDRHSLWNGLHLVHINVTNYTAGRFLF
jgi:hypothetical protein